ncbi:putative sodium/metabolite cotransporter BASS1 [Hibiscus syriacus]|uniref:Sodium/metabolite cotransporter BASS1 n=1 Tax=Hibiscus syriacus TaxID=106335 RepID=A0A6A2Z951_HIBSY|nr:putative sodium/metabolite cotransporter BASS1 [Hibiscus syriacus]
MELDMETMAASIGVSVAVLRFLLCFVATSPISDAVPVLDSLPQSDLQKPSTISFEYWDEDEFEGLPAEQPPPEPVRDTENATPNDPDPKATSKSQGAIVSKKSFTLEIICGSFLIVFAIDYFTSKCENENLALAWAAKFATKGSIFEKKFSLSGVGEGDDSPLFLKEGQTVFKFYASGRRYCQGLLTTMELKSRHDLISRLFNLVVPCKVQITLEVYMNDEGMEPAISNPPERRSRQVPLEYSRNVWSLQLKTPRLLCVFNFGKAKDSKVEDA